MAHESILVPYNAGLARLEKILARVRPPGDFFAHGSLELSMPRVEVNGIGVLSFPVPAAQVPADKVRVGGTSWDKSFADCEHEVKTVTRGHRVCLIDNLIQRRSRTADRPLTAPLYDQQVVAAAGILKTAFSGDRGPAKLAWLLEHQYSPAELAFATLKNADLALAKVLREAAAAAEWVAHLGIVPIEEYGPAEPSYDDWSGWRRRGRYHHGEREGANSDDFQVIEVSVGRSYVDQWRDTSGRAMD